MTPFVSVIIPVYNAEKYLRECLDSVVNQTLRDIEIICVDDGSTDSSPAVLAEYASRDSRVRVLTQENRYAGAARNAGMKIARGDYLSFLDADDVFDPDMLRKMFLDADARDADVVICRADRFSDSLEARTPVPWTVRPELLDVPATTVFSYKNFCRDAFTFCIGWTWDKLFSRRFIEEQGLSFSETRSTNDAYFTFLAVIFARRISFVDRVFVHQRVHADSLSRTREKDPLCYWQVVRDMKRAILARPGLWDEVGDAFMRWLAEFALWQAESLAPDARERQIAYFRDVAAPEFDFLTWLNLNAFTPEMRRVRAWLTDAPPPPLVSVIIPVYNVEKYLRQCLDSVVNQTLKEIEIICVNDGSPDNSLSILQEYANRDSRFIIIDQENQGVGRSRNTGIRKARGEFVCFMDPDDWYPENDVLETLYSTAKRERVCICGGSLEEHKPDGTVIRDFNPNASNWGGKFSQDGIMRFRDYQYDWGYQRFVFSRKFLVVNDIFFPPYIRFQDPPFFVKAMVLAEKFYALRKITYAYRVAYKEPIFSNPRKLSDMFSGIADVVNLAQTYGLEKLTERLFNQNYQSEWALSQILGTAEKSLEVATKIKRTFDLFPEELRWTTNALWWNFDKRSPIVSVVVPVYNAEKYLRRCLDSLCRQTLRNIEIVCVNDGSTDSSLQILQEYADSDSRVKIFSQKNGGEGAAKNAGISHSTGKYVAILDPDDYVDSDFYEKLACVALKNGTIITKGESKIEKDGTVSKPAWDLNSGILGNAGKLPMFARFYFQHGTAVYEREFLIKNEITFGGTAVGADLIFLLKLGTRTESISIVPDTFHYYVQSSEGVSRTYNDSYFNANLAYINICVDLLNTRNKFDAGYYIYLKGRLTQLLDTVLPQLVQSGSDFSAIKSFLEEAIGIVKKIHGIKNLTDLFPAGDSSNAFAFLSFGMEEMLARAAFLCVSKFTPGAPFVSVIVPVYNVEKYLRECLDSICGQTLRNIEIICVNDGSTDGSLAILEEYASRDSRMRIISQENRGLSAARNAGLSVARGKYIYFMDSDDVSPQGALGRMFAEMEANSLDVLFFGAESFFESEELEKAHAVYKTLYKRRPFETQSGQSLALAFKSAGCGFSPSACCYCSSRGFLNENSIRFPEGILYEDNVFFWKVLHSATRAKSISDALFRRRVRAGSTMTNKKISFRNFEGYAIVVSELEKLAGTLSGSAFPEILRNHARGTSGTLVRFYREISPEGRARSRELLAGALKDSAWLDSVRERIAGIDAEKKEEIRVDSRESDAGKKEEPCVDSREAAGEAPESGDGNAASPEEKKIYPAFLVRLGAAFILNKAARKRWRERHMDLTPKDGIDLNAHPELRRDGALKRFAVRAASLFIFSKKKRKAFRAKHLNLRPRDGVDVRAIPKQDLARLREAKRSRSTLWRVFDALVPATRGKITHTERHLRRAAEEQTRILIDELRRMHDENRRAFDESRRVVDENRRTLGAVRAELKIVRERAEALSRELAASKTELKDRTLATERALRTELSATREALTLKTLAAKHAVLDAESNLQARLGEVLESLNAARSEFAQTAAETVRAVNARADALCASAEATEMRHAETSSRLARLEEQGEAAQSAMSEIPGKLSALSELVPAAERALRRECASVAAAVSSASAETENRLESLARSAEETRERLRAYTDYRLLADALPGFIEKLRERNPLAREALTDELFASSVEASCVADCEQRFSDRIRAAFSDRTPAYYERVPAEARERELKLWFKLRTGRDLDLKHPKTFNEKIQWLKLYDVSPLKTRLADKFEVREWIREKIGEKYLTPLIGVYDTFDEIDFDRLPDKFVLKTTHGSGYNIVVKDKSRFDKADAKKKFDDWLSRKFEYQAGFEMHYAGMKPRIIAEEFLDIDESGIYEWQAFCFNGEAKFFLVIVGGAHDSTPGKRFYYSPKWEKLPFTSLARELPEGAIPCPDNFAELAECVKKLCDGFLHVRVDFYRLRDGNWKFGEMTFSTASGLWAVYPEEYDRVVGDMLTLPAEENSEK